jgi:hypothetical protein
VWWFIPVMPAFGKLKQEDCKFVASLGYIVRLYLKKQQRKPNPSPNSSKQTNKQK